MKKLLIMSFFLLNSSIWAEAICKNDTSTECHHFNGWFKNTVLKKGQKGKKSHVFSFLIPESIHTEFDLAIQTNLPVYVGVSQNPGKYRPGPNDSQSCFNLTRSKKSILSIISTNHPASHKRKGVCQLRPNKDYFLSIIIPNSAHLKQSLEITLTSQLKKR